MKKVVLLTVTVALLSGCCCGFGKKSVEGADVKASVDSSILTTDTYAKGNSGTVEYIWEEPMVDVTDIPPGLDPEGHYYRPAHQSIVEIRQGKWRYYRDPSK